VRLYEHIRPPVLLDSESALHFSDHIMVWNKLGRSLDIIWTRSAFKVDNIQSASDKSLIAAGVESVDHGDISEYLSLIRHDEIDLIFSHSIGALPSPFPLRLLFEERVYQKEPLPFEEVDEYLPPLISSSKSMRFTTDSLQFCTPTLALKPPKTTL
jgi:hypothetical protein